MTQTDDAALPPLPKLPESGKEFYDIVMGRIEPDLVTDVIPTLKEKYAAETSEDHAARMERYRQALTSYRTQKQHYYDQWRMQTKKFGRDLRTKVESDFRKEEEDTLSQLEDLLEVAA